MSKSIPTLNGLTDRGFKALKAARVYLVLKSHFMGQNLRMSVGSLRKNWKDLSFWGSISDKLSIGCLDFNKNLLRVVEKQTSLSKSTYNVRISKCSLAHTLKASEEFHSIKITVSQPNYFINCLLMVMLEWLE